ncbi:MAG: transcription elongation factor GreA [Candidatus Magasanikbacteria bacterium]|nr:transcription elongation factor GreA [Candidatus Magasanikbacteria bacterium]
MEDSAQYLTAHSLAQLQEEYRQLKDETIPEIARRIDDAKQQGDLSENAEYHQAREEMSWAQGQLQDLENILGNAQLIVSQPSDVVTIGNTIAVKTGATLRTYTIVGPQEINPAQGYISNESPLGEAFLGHRVGDTVTVKTPAGSSQYEILEIKQV